MRCPHCDRLATLVDDDGNGRRAWICTTPKCGAAIPVEDRSEVVKRSRPAIQAARDALAAANPKRDGYGAEETNDA